MEDDWKLAIDFGTTFTVGVATAVGSAAPVEIDGERRLPSAICLDESGELIVGKAAENRLGVAPERVERTPKRYLETGQSRMLLGDRVVPVTTAVGRLLQAIWLEALRQRSQKPPSSVRLTFPASWGDERRALLIESAKGGGLTEPSLISEPEAAAIYLASEQVTGDPIGERETVAVYDLGGGTFDTAVLRRKGAGFELVGEPGGDDRIGGELFDDRLYRRLGETGLDPTVWAELQNSVEPAWRAANAEFRRQVREAKEAVSRSATQPIFIPAPVSTELQVARAEFESLIREDVATTLEIFGGTLRRAGVTPADLSALYLVGGSSRIPIIAHTVRERFGRADTKGDPKLAVALGAARSMQAPNQPPGELKRDGTSDTSHERSRVIPAFAGLSAVLAAVIVAVIVSSGSGQPTPPAPSPNTTPQPVSTATPQTTTPQPVSTATQQTTTPQQTTTTQAPPSPAPNLTACDRNISAGSGTSCPFAENVFIAYAADYKQNGQQSSNSVTAASPVTHQSYNMDCSNDGTTVNCSGGNNAFVTFSFHAVQVY